MVGSRKRRKARDPDTSQSCSPEKKLGGSPSASPPQVQKRGKYSQHQAGNLVGCQMFKVA